MELFSNSNDILRLQELLNPEKDDSDVEESERIPNPYSNVSQTPSESNNPYDPLESNKPVPSSTPLPPKSRYPETFEEWEDRERELNDDYLEQRIQPTYNTSYKQAVTTEDIFLQMGNKTAATSSCEQMIIKISMPDETVDIDQMQLDVSADTIDLQTPKYRLKLPLVHKINPDKGNAMWNAEQKVLTLVLLMDREFDFVNF